MTSPTNGIFRAGYRHTRLKTVVPMDSSSQILGRPPRGCRSRTERPRQVVIRTSRMAIPRWRQVIRFAFSQIPGLGSSLRRRIATGYSIPAFSAMGILGNPSTRGQRCVRDVRKALEDGRGIPSSLVAASQLAPGLALGSAGPITDCPDSGPNSFFFYFFRIEASLLNKEGL